MPLQTPGTPLSVTLGHSPKEGAKAFPQSYNFALGATFTLDMTSAQFTAKLSVVQGIFIDNSANNAAMTVNSSGFSQTISLGAGWQGYLPIVTGERNVFTITSAGSGIATIIYLNYPVPFGLWPAAASPVFPTPLTPLAVTDVALDALITAGRLPVGILLDALITAGRLPTLSTPAANTAASSSGTITTGGSAQTAAASNIARKGWALQNIDVSLTTEEIWYSTTGTAAANTPGSFALAAYSAAGFPGGFAQGSDTGAISVIAATTGHKFSLITW